MTRKTFQVRILDDRIGRSVPFPEYATDGSAGLDLRAWNPDTLDAQRAMIALGVRGVSTNRPDILMDYLQHAKADA